MDLINEVILFDVDPNERFISIGNNGSLKTLSNRILRLEKTSYLSQIFQIQFHWKDLRNK
jgi:hypothetical protein